MKGRICLALLAAAGALGIAVGADNEQPVRTRIEEGVLDAIELMVPAPPAVLPIVIGAFPAEGADLGTGAEGGKETRVEAARAIVKLGPELLQKALEARLREGGRFQQILHAGAGELPERHLRVEGRFLKIEPGSKAKRYWASFGAGKSGVQVTGKVTDATGNVLAEFTHMKHSGIGLAGGDYLKFLSDDTKDVGADIGEFLNRWVSGGDLRKD